MVLEGGKFKIFSALRADEKRRSAPGILPPPLEKILATPLPTCEYKEKDVVDRGLPPNHSNLIWTSESGHYYMQRCAAKSDSQAMETDTTHKNPHISIFEILATSLLLVLSLQVSGNGADIWWQR